MTRIDRAFFTTAWEEIFPSEHLQAWPATVSDHCPLLQRETESLKFKVFASKPIGCASLVSWTPSSRLGKSPFKPLTPLEGFT
jgi:hypothetical protein